MPLRSCTPVRSRITNSQDHKSAALSAASHAKSDLRHTETQGQHRDPTARPVVTSPQPLRPLERRASTSTTSTRPRSPPSTLSDIASQGQFRPIHPTPVPHPDFRQEAAKPTHNILGQGGCKGGSSGRRQGSPSFGEGKERSRRDR